MEETIQLVNFKLSGEEYAIDIRSIQEVIRTQKITPVPQMPDFVLGVINIRGNVIPLFDLRKKFGLPIAEVNDNTKFIVINIDNNAIGIVVDEILDNIKLHTSHIDPAPTAKMNMDKEYIRGLGLVEKRMIVILDPERINEGINREIASTNGELTL